MSKNSNKTVVVGMSGGVDSSVAALILKQQGYKVVGMFMKNWTDENEACSAESDYEDVVRVCEQIKIPHYSINLSREYWDLVFNRFITGLKAGYTPNPDILCNREIKFKVFLERAMELGGDYLATGHYARKINKKLLKGLDKNKDQSYFIYTLKSEQLEKILFPIGDRTKEEIRKIAEENNLATASKKDSTGICFIGKRNFNTFIEKYIPSKPGNIEDLKGNVTGHHKGLHFHTIGQRKGLNIGGAGDAWFVADKDVKRNVLIAVQGKNHPYLLKKELIAIDVSWVNEPPKEFPFECTAKIRYRQEDSKCIIKHLYKNEILVQFNKPQRAITPLQSIVFYDEDICLGGGIIKPEKMSWNN